LSCYSPTFGSAIVLNRVITPAQALGGAVMIAARRWWHFRCGGEVDRAACT